MIKRTLSKILAVNRFNYRPSARHIIRTKFFDARDPKYAEKEKQLVLHQSSQYFDTVAKDKEDKRNFMRAIAMYIAAEKVRRRGHVEFINAALQQMKRFNVHRDLETYKMLMKVFPTEVMVAKRTWEVEWQHYPKQQQCAIDLMDQMEYYSVIPDDQFGYMLKDVFGDKAHAFRKYRRMMYWLPKFKNVNPYPIPLDLPNDPRELALIALKRMSIDLQTEYSIFETSELDNAIDKTFVASAQSWRQRELIESHDAKKPLFVEGGYTIWLRDNKLQYFKLWSEANPNVPKHVFPEDLRKKYNEKNLFNFKTIFDDEREHSLTTPNVMHQQADGTVLGLCITGTGSKESLVSWVTFLQKTNKKLADIPVIFTLKSPTSQISILKEEEKFKFEIKKKT
ncbi:unnamed protein product [Dimorphilus gyrociliatus]|uniref:Evolutionarily conserved signaling intermediate in Toll pathway, mitochondrial n=1 Tax=Dimorphilus gyrociliatus TaxID=2664684 RepID=A0A7I8VN41_9ANNE|nr:unnamed protein product [Dimorphilus gyrociliatus]